MTAKQIATGLRLTAGATLLGHAWVGFLEQFPRGFPLPGPHHDAWVLAQSFTFAALGLSLLLSPRGILFATCCFASSINLFYLAWAKWIVSGVGAGQFFEHASQFLAPLLLLLAVRTSTEERPWSKSLDRLARRAVALTFFCHGLFAFGVSFPAVPLLHHPTPLAFIEMTQACLGIETTEAAAAFLRVAGIIDFVVAIAVFLPKGRALPLAYMALWGFLTALARPWAHVDLSHPVETLVRWFPEFLYRTPHWALPLLMLLTLRARMKTVTVSHGPA